MDDVNDEKIVEQLTGESAREVVQTVTAPVEEVRERRGGYEYSERVDDIGTEMKECDEEAGDGVESSVAGV